MKLYIHKTTARVTTGVRSSTRIERITAIRLNTLPLELFFHDGVTAAPLQEGSTGRVIVKNEAAPLGDVVLAKMTWDLPVTVDAGYVFRLLVASTALTTELGNLPAKTFDMEIVWWEGSERKSTGPIDFVVTQTYLNGDELMPDPELATASFLLTSPDDSQWKISISDDGQIVATKP